MHSLFVGRRGVGLFSCTLLGSFNGYYLLNFVVKILKKFLHDKLADYISTYICILCTFQRAPKVIRLKKVVMFSIWVISFNTIEIRRIELLDEVILSFEETCSALQLLRVSSPISSKFKTMFIKRKCGRGERGWTLKIYWEDMILISSFYWSFKHHRG